MYSPSTCARDLSAIAARALAQKPLLVHNIRTASVPKRSKGIGCKPIDFGLRWFESNPAHLIQKASPARRFLCWVLGFEPRAAAPEEGAKVSSSAEREANPTRRTRYKQLPWGAVCIRLAAFFSC